MRRKVTMIVLCLAVIILGLSTTGFAANSFTFSETYQQKGDCYILWGIPFCDEGAVGGKFAIASKISLNGIDITKFDDNTKFVVEVGGLFFEAKLGDDWKYAPGATSFNVSYVDRLDESYKPVKYITINLKWTSKLLTAKISGITPDFLSPIAADIYLGSFSGKITDSTNGYIALGDNIYAGFNINYSGTVSTKKSKSKNGQDTVTSKVSIKGSGTETSQDFRHVFEESRAARKRLINVYE